MAEFKGRMVGTYRLIDRLGQGGMGVVYRAVDTTLDREVAIKMMVPQGDDNHVEVAARFLVEAKAAARIQSRHVASVLQLGQTDEGEVYIVMELLAGQPLSKLLQTQTRLDARRAARIGCHVAKGMAAAHALGIVHRDLKPANIMLVDADGEHEVAKILDFGVAKLTKDGDGKNLTQTGALLGTLPYMAPEQVLGKAVDARTDIYALGVLMYRMLSGQPLYDAESLSDIVRHQVQTPAPLFAERMPGLVVDPALERVVLKCLQKEPARRFATMTDVHSALTAAVELTGSTPARQLGRVSHMEETLPTGTKLEGAVGAKLRAAGTTPSTEPTSVRGITPPHSAPPPQLSSINAAGALAGTTTTSHGITARVDVPADNDVAVTKPMPAAVVPASTGRPVLVGLLAAAALVALGTVVVLAAVMLSPPKPGPATRVTTTSATDPTPTATVPTATVPTATVPTATVPTASIETVPSAAVSTATEPTATEPTATEPTATAPTGKAPSAVSASTSSRAVGTPDDSAAANKKKPTDKVRVKAKTPAVKTPANDAAADSDVGGFRRVLTKGAP